MDEVAIQAQARQIDRFGTTPSAAIVQDEQLEQEVQEFFRVVVRHLEDLKRACEAGRESNKRNFARRMEIARRRNQIRPEVITDENGEVVVNLEDGHAEMGIMQGWTRQANKTVGAYLYANLIKQFKRPYVLLGRGMRAENRMLEKSLYAVIDDQLRKGRFKRVMRYVSRMVPVYGTAVLRYDLGRRVRFSLGPNGQFTERDPEYCPAFTVWPLEQVLVTQYGSPEAQDQEGVFWLSPDVTLAQLEAEEAIYQQQPLLGDTHRTEYRSESMSPETGSMSPGLQFVSGRFRLDTLRQWLIDQQGTGSTAGATGETARASSFPTATLVEYEGALPMGMWARMGVLTPRVAQFLGIGNAAGIGGSSKFEVRGSTLDGSDLSDGSVGNAAGIGMSPEEDPDAAEEAEAQSIEWAARLSHIPIWNVSYLIEPQYGGASGVLPIDTVIQFEPDRHKNPRNSLFVFGYTPDDTEFLRQSICDLGRKLEDAGDCLRNADLWISYFNAHPSALVNKQLTAGQDIASVSKLLRTPGAIVEGLPGAVGGIRDAVQLMQLPQDGNAEQKIAALKMEHEFTTGASAAAKGSDTAQGTGTLGEIQINESKANLDLNDIVADNGSELARLIQCLIEDIYYFMGPEQFLEYCTKVSGLPTKEIERVIHTVDGIEEDLVVEHPATATGDTATLATILMRLFSVVGREGFPDIQKFTSTVLEIAGYARGEDLTLSETSMDPEDEHSQMAQGNWVAPKVGENYMEHILAHSQFFRQIQAGVNPYDTPEELQNILSLLPQHTDQTMRLVESIMAMQMQGLQDPAGPMVPGMLGAPSGPAGAQPGGGAPGGSGEKAAAMAGSEPETGGEIGQSAREDGHSVVS